MFLAMPRNAYMKRSVNERGRFGLLSSEIHTVHECRLKSKKGRKEKEERRWAKGGEKRTTSPGEATSTVHEEERESRAASGISAIRAINNINCKLAAHARRWCWQTPGDKSPARRYQDIIPLSSKLLRSCGYGKVLGSCKAKSVLQNSSRKNVGSWQQRTQEQRTWSGNKMEWHMRGAASLKERRLLPVRKSPSMHDLARKSLRDKGGRS